jgi:hypothetical protein
LQGRFHGGVSPPAQNEGHDSFTFSMKNEPGSNSLRAGNFAGKFLKTISSDQLLLSTRPRNTLETSFGSKARRMVERSETRPGLLPDAPPDVPRSDVAQGRLAVWHGPEMGFASLNPSYGLPRVTVSRSEQTRIGFPESRVFCSEFFQNVFHRSPPLIDAPFKLPFGSITIS